MAHPMNFDKIDFLCFFDFITIKQTGASARAGATEENMELRTRVLIIGGGAAGLTSSMLLSQAGIDTILVERHKGTSILPKAHVLNQPTMEVFSELGVAAEIYTRGTPRENISRSGWFTSLTGPTSLHGRKIGDTSCFGGGALIERYAAASPCEVTNLPQIRLEPILRRRAEALAPDRLRFHHELVRFREEGDTVVATILDRDSGQELTIRADYMIGADGGRFVGPALGVAMEGETELVSMVSAHISADLSRWSDDQTLINFYINPDGAGSMGSGVLVKMGPDHWGRHSEEWVFHCAFRPDDPAQFDEPTMLQRMRDSLGIPDFAPKIHVISQWQVQGTVARRFQIGRVFLMGDAVHRHPPTTGLGLNTAVGDAYNLCWKLAAVLRGEAGPQLLASYEVERRHVARLIVRQALTTFFQHQEIDQAIGLAPGQSAAEGWAVMATLFAEGPEGDAARARVAGTIANHLEFGALNVELGYVYEEGAIIADGTTPPANPDPVRNYLPSGRPGHRLPHAWVIRGGERRSTFHLFGSRRLTLFIGDDGEAWRQAAARIAARTGIVLDIVVIGDSAWRDVSDAWRRQSGLDSGGALLLRPDARIAWRGFRADPDTTASLEAAVVTLLDRAGAGR